MDPTRLIDKEIARHPDWRGAKMAEIRRVIRATVPDVTEEWKWMGTPTWSHNGILCICNAFKDFVKVTFINGAQLKDAGGVFNAELEGNKWRAIKHFEGDRVDEAGLRKALHAAVAFNAGKGKKPRAKTTAKAKPTNAVTRKPKASAKAPKPRRRTAR